MESPPLRDVARDLPSRQTDSTASDTQSLPAELRGPSVRTGVACCVVMTLLYWYWESQTGGNIRVDLLLAYPLMLVLYLFFLQRIGWISLPIAIVMMAVNYAFFTVSYSLFDKPPG